MSLPLNSVIHGDCLIESEQIESGLVDLILTDLPYGTIKNAPKNWTVKNDKSHEWDDEILPVDIFNISNRLLRKNGRLLLFAQQPYTTELIKNAIPNLPHSYNMIWEKNDFANGLLCNKAPVGYYEDILVFSKHFESENNDDNPCKEYAVRVFDYMGKSMDYLKNFYGNSNLSHFYSNGKQFRLCTEQTYNNIINDFGIDKMQGFKKYAELQKMNRDYKNGFASTFNLWEGKKYKRNILKYAKDYNGYHPTQKPVLLLEDLIKTFSNEGDLVVDLTAGSGSTAVACINTGRRYIVIEKEQKYIDIINGRISEHEQQLTIGVTQ